MDISATPPPADQSVPLRPSAVVMDLARLGTLYPYRLSFMRSLMRRMMSEQWQIQRTIFDLDDSGYGVAVYEIQTEQNLFSFVVFAHYLDPEKRNDRVIAEAWDMTVTLCEGTVDDTRLEILRVNVPLQEKGRLDSRCIVLSRANKSARSFDYIVNSLAAGEEPSWNEVSKVGYLYRTTAVYGSGKFGMADWQKVSTSFVDFARPFAAEMFTCFMIRQFSMEQAEHIAEMRSPDTAVKMSDTLKRYIGIGNATGLGMAPYLINHPLLISKWIEVRETALARVLSQVPDDAAYVKFSTLTKRVIAHLAEIKTENSEQHSINEKTKAELIDVIEWVYASGKLTGNWQSVTKHIQENYHIETQELINTIIIELYPDLVDGLDEGLSLYEYYPFVPEMSVEQLREIISEKYDWALSYNFFDDEAHGVFWYRSEEKMEPRLGKRNEEPGDDREMLIGIASHVRKCFDDLSGFIIANPDETVARFVMAHPEHRLIIRRIQTMAETVYGDIRTNLLEKKVLPIHLLRCKLSFFGVARFDPRSRLWVRNTMFQGAPITNDIGKPFDDDWFFPVLFQKHSKTHDTDNYTVS